jgi:hypothetical protein
VAVPVGVLDGVAVNVFVAVDAGVLVGLAVGVAVGVPVGMGVLVFVGGGLVGAFFEGQPAKAAISRQMNGRMNQGFRFRMGPPWNGFLGAKLD